MSSIAPEPLIDASSERGVIDEQAIRECIEVSRCLLRDSQEPDAAHTMQLNSCMNT